MNTKGTDQEKRLWLLLRTLFGVIITGLGFGFVMAFVSNGFVLGVRWLTELRSATSFLIIDIAGVQLSFGPLFTLMLAAAAILGVRHLFGISRWHGPADSIYAAHRTDNELDVRVGFWFEPCCLYFLPVVVLRGQYGPLVHFGGDMGSFIRQNNGIGKSLRMFLSDAGLLGRLRRVLMRRLPEWSLRMRPSCGISLCGRLPLLPSPASLRHGLANGSLAPIRYSCLLI